jgi:DNA-binding transcriptional regulator/RsmH inhibitor MraZ
MWFYLLLAFTAGLIVSRKVSQYLDDFPDRLLDKLGEEVSMNELPANERREMRRLLLGTPPTNVVSIDRQTRGLNVARSW